MLGLMSALVLHGVPNQISITQVMLEEPSIPTGIASGITSISPSSSMEARLGCWVWRWRLSSNKPTVTKHKRLQCSDKDFFTREITIHKAGLGKVKESLFILRTGVFVARVWIASLPTTALYTRHGIKTQSILSKIYIDHKQKDSHRTQ